MLVTSNLSNSYYERTHNKDTYLLVISVRSSSWPHCLQSRFFRGGLALPPFLGAGGSGEGGGGEDVTLPPSV